MKLIILITKTIIGIINKKVNFIIINKINMLRYKLYMHVYIHVYIFTYIKYSKSKVLL